MIKAARNVLLPMILLASATAISAQETPPVEYRLDYSYSSRTETSDGDGAGSASGRTAMIERRLTPHADGWTVEYDLPLEPGEERKPLDWQFPARVMFKDGGRYELLNADELRERNEKWRELAGLSSSACGSWYFTWNAFKVECDPLSVLETVRSYDLRYGNLVDGQDFSFDGGIGAVPLRLVTGGPDGSTFQAVFDIDAEKVTESRIKSDLAVAQIMGESLLEDEARAKRSGEKISGSLSVILTTDREGNVWRRETLSRIETMSVGRGVTTQTDKTVLERKPLPAD